MKDDESHIKKRIDFLEQLHKVSRKNFKDMTQLLVATISLSNRFLGGHLKRVAESARDFAMEEGYDDDRRELLYYSGLLHDIGMVGMPEKIIFNDTENFSAEELFLYRKHPVIGEELIGTIYNLRRIAASIRSHHEDYSGSGFPDGLKGRDIPFTSRLIRIASDYDNLIFRNGKRHEDAISELEKQSSILYDPQILYTFCRIKERDFGKEERRLHKIRLKDIQTGMMLNSDIVLRNGLLLLPKGIIVNSKMLEKLKSFRNLIDERIREVEVFY